MSIFNGLLNTFKNNNTKTNNSATRAVVTGTSVGQSNKTKAPQSQPVRWNAKSQSKSSVSSDTCGAANWFNGIGTTSSKTPDKLTVYDGKGNPLTLTAAATNPVKTSPNGVMHPIMRHTSLTRPSPL